MRVLSLFSGGGLGDFGLEKAGMEIVGQVEWDKYCQKILKLRWPEVPKWEDVRDVTGEQVREKCGKIDMVAGGFPCQPFSVAGKKKGKEDERNMWPAMYRIISEVKPTWVLAENVRGIVKPYLDTVLTDLESLGYTCLPLLIPASAVGAPHRRERLWILGYSELHGQSAAKNTGGLNEGSDFGDRTKRAEQPSESSGSGDGERGFEDVADTASSGQLPGTIESGANGKEIRRTEPDLMCDKGAGESWWSVEPAVGRVAHGVANRVDRLKLLGNGQVVQVVEWIGIEILKMNEMLDLF